MVQLLEIALVDRVDKELDLLQPYSSDTLIDLLPTVSLEDDSVQLEDEVTSILRGRRCSTAERAADYLLMILTSERLQSDDVDKFSIAGQSFHMI